ncbi:MAG: copper homeostasis protein CutC [Marinifilaceae bacterium]
MKQQQLEICVYSLESIENAQQSGANRVELCAGASEGGITPSYATIRMAKQMCEIELFVMIRPRGGDFLYSDYEFQQMKQDILFAKECGVDGVVLGILNPDGSVDVKRTKELVNLAAPLKVTFHRAFDMCNTLDQALEDVITTGCFRILTSGQMPSAFAGINNIKRLAQQSAGRIQIMAGAGVNHDNASALLDTGVDAIHFSASSYRDSGMIFRNPIVSMSSTPGQSEYDVLFADPIKICDMVALIRARG